jgi:uncharacterized protein (TIRG00374 family)
MDLIVFSLSQVFFAVFAFIYIFFFLDVPFVSTILKIALSLLLFGALVLLYIWKKGGRKGMANTAETTLRKIYNFRFFGVLRKKFKKFSAFKRFVKRQYVRFIGTLKKLWSNKIRLFLILDFAVMIQIFDFLSMWALLLGLGQSISFAEIIVVLTVSGIIGYFVFLPGGSGMVEASMIAILSAMGINPVVATAATLINRAFFYLVSYGIGYVSLVYVYKNYK